MAKIFTPTATVTQQDGRIRIDIEDVNGKTSAVIPNEPMAREEAEQAAKQAQIAAAEAENFAKQSIGQAQMAQDEAEKFAKQAQTASGEAQTAAASAASSASAAKTSQTAAASSATAAKTSQTAAASSAAAASSQATAAAKSAASAAASATSAADSASKAMATTPEGYEALVDQVTDMRDAIQNGRVIYGFHIDSNESDPAAAVTYLKDAVGMTPAKMDYTNGVFDYGSWEDAFFMPRPCMLNQDGTVAYYLDPNDLTKKEDGTDSDVADTSFAGNAMMEWGRDGKKIWLCVVPKGDGTSADVFISNRQVTDDYHAWSFMDATDKGLPLGFYTSQWLSNWLLQDLDHYIKEELHAKKYVRYMDDMVIFGANKRKLHRAREKIAEYLQAHYGLEMKENWQVFRFSYKRDGDDKGRPLDFMGFRFYRTRTTLRRSIMLRITRKARRLRKRAKITILDARQMLSYLGWIKATDTYKMYLNRIKPFVNFQSLKRKVARYDKHHRKEAHNVVHIGIA